MFGVLDSFQCYVFKAFKSLALSKDNHQNLSSFYDFALHEVPFYRLKVFILQKLRPHKTGNAFKAAKTKKNCSRAQKRKKGQSCHKPEIVITGTQN